jgi:hypothetical protein
MNSICCGFKKGRGYGKGNSLNAVDRQFIPAAHGYYSKNNRNKQSNPNKNKQSS